LAGYDDVAFRTCTKCAVTYPATPENFGQVRPGQMRGRCRPCEIEKNRIDGKTRDRTARDRKRRQLEAGLDVSKLQKDKMYRRQNKLCLLCAKEIPSISECSVDHMIPLSKGGSNDTSNLHLVHKLCNTDKKDKTVLEHWRWRVESGFDEINIGDLLGIRGEPVFK
jgi:5-methylcytosine-specific restriction endonuclease McrA